MKYSCYPKIIYTHVFAKFVHMHIQRIFTTNEITFHAYSSILLLKLHFNSTRFLVRYLLLSICNIHISCEVFCHIIYIYVCMMNNILKHLWVRQTSWCSPKIDCWPKGKFLSQCFHFHAFLHSKPKAWIPRAKSLIWALILTSTCCPYTHKSAPQSKVHKTTPKFHWGISPSTWWAHFWVPITRE